MSKIASSKKPSRLYALYSQIKTFVHTKILAKSPEKYIFFFSEYGLKSHVEYSVFPISATGSVPLERAVEVAEKYARRGYKIVLDKNPKGENLPISPNMRKELIDELNILVMLDAIDNKPDQKRFARVEHPGWNRLEKILNKIPKQVL